MDAGIITAIAALLSALGAGAWKLIDRADKKRERRESAVEQLLKDQYAKLEAQMERERRQAQEQYGKLEAQMAGERQQFKERDDRKNVEISHLKVYNSRIKSAAGKWREQLIAHDIQPDPADWPEDNPHE